MDWTQALALGHVSAAVAALLAGAVVLVLPKGTRPHRMMGTGYVVALLVVNAAALSLHRESTFGVFHWLSLASLLTIAVGLVPMVLGRRSAPVIATHAYCMTWSYAGLLAAGCGQLTALVDPGVGGWLVPAVISAVLAGCGAAIALRVPSILGRLLAD